MSRKRKVFSIISGLFQLFCSGILFMNPKEGIVIIAAVLCILLLVNGLRLFAYYFMMARHMVGGKIILLTAVFLLDLGLFTSSMNSFPRLYVLLYLLGYHVFFGVINVLRGIEAKQYNSPEWKPNVVQGAVDILLALTCLLFVRSVRVLVYAYCLTLAWSACMRIASAFRQSAVIFIGP